MAIKQKDAAAKIKQLSEELHRHNKAYYQSSSTTISDAEFDKLLRQLQLLEQQFPNLLQPDSPTQKVGGKAEEQFKKQPHNPPMLSLDNAFPSSDDAADDDLQKFNDRILKQLEGQQPEYLTELKIDGVSINLIYENGKLANGVTRGDGKIGEVVTENARQINGVPPTIKFKKSWARVEVRGEVYMTLTDFKTLNKKREEEGLPLFANPRNGAAGAIRLLDATEAGKRKLHIFAYGIYIFDKNGNKLAPFTTQQEVLQTLQKLHFPIEEDSKLQSNLTDVRQEISAQGKKRHSRNFETDGLVIIINSLLEQRELGSTSKFPRYAIAYKYPPEQAETMLTGITIQVGRTGRLTPVAELKPVNLSGSTISRATLHNEDELKKKDVRIGDSVIIEKAGEIIPQVVKVVKAKRTASAKSFKMPSHCPACNGKIVRKDGEAVSLCINQTCPEKIRHGLRWFASKNCMDIDGLGSAIIDNLIKVGMVKSVPDIFRLDYSAIAEMEKMGEKSASNIKKSIEEAKERGMAKLLTALGIKYVGTQSAMLLAKHYSSLPALAKADAKELEKIHDIGSVVASRIAEWFKETGNIKLIEELKQLGLKMDSDDEEKRPQTLAGKTFVITGTLPNMGRTEARDLIIAAGGKVSGSISKKTSYLLAGESAGSKLEKAAELLVKVIDLDSLKKLLTPSQNRASGNQAEQMNLL